MARISDQGAFISRMLATGGDRRIRVAPGAPTNMYGASPFPRDMLAYAATTANDISLDGFDHLRAVVSGWSAGGMSGADYAAALEELRHSIRQSYCLEHDTDIVFAPSGTDLEFVALHLAMAVSGKAVTNILLGADEVGSGCGLAAAGRYFSGETVLAEAVAKGGSVEGFEGTATVEIPVRDSLGRPLSSADIRDAVYALAKSAVEAGRQALVHVVHGSKTGLVLPSLDDIDALRARFGDALTVVVDACQARISPCSIKAYLDRGAIVFVTGSKFMGGPPFSGFALVPAGTRSNRPLPRGFATLFRRAEWPENWRGAEHLDASANPGLLLRLEAALFELERFRLLPADTVNAVSASFNRATRRLADMLGARHICPSAAAPLAATMATLDLSPLTCAPDFETAQRWQRVLAARGIRLGQPVKCVRLSDGRWGGTLRISLSMPTIVSLAAMTEGQADAKLLRDMESIAEILGAAARPVAA